MYKYVLQETFGTLQFSLGDFNVDMSKRWEIWDYETIIREKYGIDVYKSDGFKFTIEDGKIRIPLIGINGLGASVVENIVKERELGKFISYEDLKRRTKTSETVLEKLKSVNAIEGLSETNQISLF